MKEIGLSSRDRATIPKAIRKAWGLESGARFRVSIQDRKIVLAPLTGASVDSLYGKYPNVDLLGDLETEHRQEIEHDA
jgi:bifunctional DNA-binding transcriptional regulator/antitoxin component of YhaV-PrlF toxin-antitoxin module